MREPLLERWILRLYPPSFRRRFGAEWLETVAWHRRTLRGRRLSSVRLAATLLVDALKNLPEAWWRMGEGGGGRGGRGSWGGDVRYALVALTRNRAFAAAAVASVAFGIAVNTATFSVVNGVLLRPLPYAAPDRLGIVWNEFPTSGMVRLPLTGPQVEMLREQPDLFEDVGGVWATSGTVLDAEGRIAQVALGVVSPNLFEVLGVGLELGPGWMPDGLDGPVPQGVVLGHELWQVRYGGDPRILERTIDLDGRAVQVVGVLPRGFTIFFPEDGAIPPSFDVYRPLPWDLSVLPPDQHYLRVVGRLGPGTSWSRAADGVVAVAERARATYPQLQASGDRLSVQPLHADTVRAARPVLLALSAAVGLFLLLAATNVASLVFARTLSRAREMAIRLSLGASRAGLVRLVLVESLVITVLGSGIGIGLGRLGATLLWSLRPGGLSRADALPLDARVLAFSVGLSVLAGLVFAGVSLLAVRAARPSLGVRAAGGGGGPLGRRVRELLTAAEVALGIVLVVGSALMIQSVVGLGRESVGFDPGTALTFRVPLSLQRFPTDEERERVAGEIERGLAELPGVVAAGASSHLPFVGWANWGEAAPPEGAPEEERGTWFADLRSVTPSFLDAIGAELVAGRLFDARDAGDGGPVVIVDETMARRLFPDGGAVGRVVEPTRYVGGAFAITPATVVGVVRDIRDRSPARPSTGQVFWPYGQSPRWELTFYVRTAGDPLALAGDVQRVVAAISPDLAPARMAPMSDHVSVVTGLTRFLALVGGVFSTLALVLAAIGLYGVVAFVTVQRTGEIAVRMVVGASGGQVVRAVVLHGLRIGVLGVALGLAASLALARLMQGLVYGVSPYDPATLLTVGALMLAVAGTASLLPARRAVSLDPVAALRDT